MEKLKIRKDHKKTQEQEEVIIPELQYKKKERKKTYYKKVLSEEKNIEHVRASKRSTHIVIDRMEGKSVEEKRNEMKKRVKLQPSAKETKSDFSFSPKNIKQENRLKKEINKEEKKKYKKNYKFSDKTHPIMGILSVIIAIIGLITFGTICMQSGLQNGSTTFVMGLIGVLLFVVSIVGFILAIKSFKKNEIHYRFPILGLLLNGFMMVLFITLYVLGLVG